MYNYRLFVGYLTCMELCRVKSLHLSHIQQHDDSSQTSKDQSFQVLSQQVDKSQTEDYVDKPNMLRCYFSTQSVHAYLYKKKQREILSTRVTHTYPWHYNSLKSVTQLASLMLDFESIQ